MSAIARDRIRKEFMASFKLSVIYHTHLTIHSELFLAHGFITDLNLLHSIAGFCVIRDLIEANSSGRNRLSNKLDFCYMQGQHAKAISYIALQNPTFQKTNKLARRPTLMSRFLVVLGTTSHSGKSSLVAALCRLLSERGL